MRFHDSGRTQGPVEQEMSAAAGPASRPIQGSLTVPAAVSRP